MGGTYNTHGRDAYKIVVGKLEGNRSLERSRRRLKDNIRMDPQADVSVWIVFICLRIEQVAGSCEHGNETLVSIQVGELLH
jgi:hypothetical protein